MGIDRRKFLSFAAILALTPVVDALPTFKEPVGTLLPYSGFTIDYTNKVIITDPSKEYYTPLDLHRALQEAFDSKELITEPIPTRRHTDRHIEMINGWEIGAENETLLSLS